MYTESNAMNEPSYQLHLMNLRSDWMRYQTVDIKADIFNCKDARDACLLSKTKLSSQASSPLLEKWIKSRLGILPPRDETSGDGVFPNGETVEIKVSLGAQNGQFNFVQLRPDHDIDEYLFLTYDIIEDECLWLVMPPDVVYGLLPKYGGYAHGTMKANGKITPENLHGKGYEYALRPNPHKLHTKNGELWTAMFEYAYSDYTDFLWQFESITPMESKG